MKIVELVIDELEELFGFDAVALVEQPAHEGNFFAFNNDDVEDAILYQIIKNEVLKNVSQQFVTKLPGESKDDYISRCIPKLTDEGYDVQQATAICYADWDSFEADVSQLPDFVDELKDKEEQFESYTDYPQSATNAAKRALEWRDSHPDQDCGTRVGWARANQLANREPISEETIARMASFARHLQHEDIPYSEGCGGLMVDAWGGRAGIEWAQRKLKHIRDERDFNKFAFSVHEDQQIVVGPLMIPNKLIFRVDENGEPYYVYFTEDTIQKIARKMMREEKLDDINLEHVQDALVDGHLVETWLVEDPSKDKQQVYGMEYPAGTWMGMYKVEDKGIWEKVKSGELKGFSIEGYFADRLVQR